MDSYSLDEVKMLIDKDLLTNDVLKNILISSKRRLELYDDSESLNILRFLATNDLIPEEVKEEINKYIAEYNSSTIREKEDEDINNKVINWRVVLVYALIFTLAICVIALYIIYR